MNSEQTKAAGSGARAITRGEEARVADALHAVLNGGGYHLQWGGDRLKAIHCFHWSATSVEKMAARAGIVPGPEGWCWAAAPLDACPLCHATAPYTHQPGCAELRPIVGSRGTWSVGAGAPPAWLTAAVLAALPGDGTPRDLMGIHNQSSIAEHPRCRDKVPAALAHLVNTGEIETGEQPGTWRRWGVPEGWHLVSDDDSILLMRDDTKPGTERAIMREDGTWTLYAEGWNTAIIGEGTASPPTLAAARTAALRACYERGVFGPRPVAAPVTSTPQAAGMGEQVAIAAPPPDRPAAIRLALLAILQRGPVVGRSYVLAALDAEGVHDASEAEARRAAAEVGAEVDGARWSLPPIPPGYSWHVHRGAVYLAPTDSTRPITDAVASVDGAGSHWYTYAPGIDGKVIDEDDGEDAPACRAAALAAARRAGLFARPSQPEAPAAPAPPDEPVTAPLDALALAILGAEFHEDDSVAMVNIRGRAAQVMVPALAAFRADIIAEARSSLHDVTEAIRSDAREEQRGELEDAIAARDEAEARARRDLAATRAELATALAALAASEAGARAAVQRAADLRAGHDLAVAHDRQATGERDAALAELAALQRGLDGLRTWATAARGGAL